ncbi:MAG: pantetheine-phosphate adenylyltransferase [Ignavibacteria bacterium]|nr:pantetheine-phosphate adenylyltransferase [Ignavibacteria bacterium]
MERRVAIYPGTFDPITYGHIDVVNRATKLFSKVIIVVARNTSKNPLFSADERLAMVEEIFKKNKRVDVHCFDGLLVAYAKRKKATVIIRGLRAVSDFEYEFQMALTNRKMEQSVDTVFLVPHERYTYLNSSIVREVARLGGDVSDFVPESVQRHLTAKVQSTSKKKL